MTQPEYVPLAAADKVRPGERLPPAKPWTADRPADLKGSVQPRGPRFGSPGPDQGYALKLVRQFEDRLQLTDGEHRADVVSGVLVVALKRASLFGRAPVIHDLEHAFTLFGCLGDAPEDLVALRQSLFQSASHHYWEQREIADLVPESTLGLTPGAVRSGLAEWQNLLLVAPRAESAGEPDDRHKALRELTDLQGDNS